jgi:gamma-D-glutamyl-L-lysine dipeptidyl-peptidase
MDERLAVVAHNVVSLHKEPDSSSEQVTQAIMGQPAWVEDQRDEWLHLRTWDSYHGWARTRWIAMREGDAPYASDGLRAVVNLLFADVRTAPTTSSEILTKVVISTELVVVEEADSWLKVLLPDGRYGFIAAAAVWQDELPGSAGTDLTRTAGRFIGVPYLWGGTTPFGLDCSGFVQLVYRIHGWTLLRDAHMQADDERGLAVELNELLPGDLVFFAGAKDSSRITHVGMALGDGRFIHAAGKGAGVGTDRLDDPYYGSIYWGARRMLR